MRSTCGTLHILLQLFKYLPRLYAAMEHFPSCILPPYQNESSYENIHMKMCSSYRFCTRTRLKTEVQGNSKMNIGGKVCKETVVLHRLKV